MREKLFLTARLFIGVTIISFHTAAYAHETPDSLAAAWIDAIKAHSTGKMALLIHPQCSSENIQDSVVERMVSGEIPPDVSVVVSELGPKDALAKVFEIIPDKQLNLVFVTHTDSDKRKFGLGKGFPIALYKSAWFFIVCTKPAAAAP